MGWQSFFHGPVARVAALYCNLDHSLSLGGNAFSPHLSSLNIPCRGYGAAGNNPSSVNKTRPLALLIAYSIHIKENNNIWPTLWIQLNPGMGINLIYFSIRGPSFGFLVCICHLQHFCSVNTADPIAETTAANQVSLSTIIRHLFCWHDRRITVTYEAPGAFLS